MFPGRLSLKPPDKVQEGACDRVDDAIDVEKDEPADNDENEDKEGLKSKREGHLHPTILPSY